MKLLDNIKRNILLINTDSPVYFYWSTLAIVFFGVFGIIPLSTNLVKKAQTINKSQGIIANMQHKKIQLEDAKNELNQVQNYLPNLNIYIPNEIILEDNMVEIVGSAAKTGFFVKKFNPDENVLPDGIEVKVTLEGGASPVTLVKDIENLKRIVKIEKVTTYEIGRASC